MKISVASDIAGILSVCPLLFDADHCTDFIKGKFELFYDYFSYFFLYFVSLSSNAGCFTNCLAIPYFNNQAKDCISTKLGIDRTMMEVNLLWKREKTAVDSLSAVYISKNILSKVKRYSITKAEHY